MFKFSATLIPWRLENLMDDSQWYFEDHGRAQGPITTRELLNKLQKGELTLIDLVFKDGDGEWMPIESVREIMDLMGTVSMNQNSDWIILRTVEVDGRERHEQIGPFNVEQVLELIDKGKIKFSDHVWKTGFENWVPLGKLDKFDQPLLSSVDVDLSLYKIPSTQELDEKIPVKAYTPLHKFPEIQDDGRPADAQSDDLAEAGWIKDLKKKTSSPEEDPLLSAKKVESVAAGTEAEIQVRRPRLEDAQEKTVEIERSSEEFEKTEEIAPRTLASTVLRWRRVAQVSAVFAFLAGVGMLTYLGQRHFTSDQHVTFEKPNPEIPTPRLDTAPAVPPVEVSAPVAEAPVTKEVTKNISSVSSAKTPERSQAQAAEPLAKQSFKKRSFYHHQERMFVFYNSQKGARLAGDLQTLIKKKPKSTAIWKKQYAGWQKSAKTYVATVGREAPKAKLHGGLYKSLKNTSLELESAGRDINAQMLSGRGPTKVSSLQNVMGDFKRLGQRAKALDQ